MNLDKCTGEGTHWTGLFVRNSRAVYFDSLGGKVPKQISKKYRIIARSKRRIQKFSSIGCGQFTILFIFLMSKGYSLRAIEEIISNNNDSDLTEMINKL